jgi:hypothetical protein
MPTTVFNNDLVIAPPEDGNYGPKHADGTLLIVLCIDQLVHFLEQ